MNFTKIQWLPAENAEELCYWPFLKQIKTDTAAKNTDQNTITVTAVNQLHDWLSMVLRLRHHNIGYTADGFYRSFDPINSVKAAASVTTGHIQDSSADIQFYDVLQILFTHLFNV